MKILFMFWAIVAIFNCIFNIVWVFENWKQFRKASIALLIFVIAMYAAFLFLVDISNTFSNINQ